MKLYILALALTFLVVTDLFAQNSVGIGTSSPSDNAVLELYSTNRDQGFLVPRLTTAERTAQEFVDKLSAVDNGLMVYDSELNEFFFWVADQWISLNISSADADSDPNNEIQDLQLQGNQLTITGHPSPTSIDLSPFSGTNTDNQTLSLSGTELSIAGGNMVDLTGVQDGYEANTDAQLISLAGTQLSISNGNSVDLGSVQDGFEANTDAQTLGFAGQNLSISGGNTVTLPLYFAFEAGNSIEGIPDKIDVDYQIKSPALEIEGGPVITGTKFRTLDYMEVINNSIYLRNTSSQNRARHYIASDAGHSIYYGPNNSTNVRVGSDSGTPSHGKVGVYDINGTIQASMYVNSSNQGVLSADTKPFHMQHPSKPDYQIWYCAIEGPEAAAYIRGQAEIVNGEAMVEFDEHFLEVANMEGLTIQLTPHSAESKGLAAIERTGTGFKIKELFGGTGSYKVDWEAKGKRLGYENFKVLRHKSDPDYLK